MHDHPARRLVPDLDECSICGEPVEGENADLRHLGGQYRQRIVPARTDSFAFNRGVAVLAQALDRLSWTPSLDNEARARAGMEALYAAGLVTSRPRKVRARKISGGPRNKQT
ncbi:hypothetical protein [Actinomadura sp. 3N508]|uniref:hypothetical protein n=1 Tax=Actinomadura sp. 3N508 TaxID=3375153 RepID=UPI0037955E69